MQPILFVRRIAKQWVAHDNSRSAAAIGFYAIFTLAPMLVFATTGLGLFVGHQEAQSLTEARLAKTMGPSGARIAHEVLVSADFSRQGVLASVVSGVLLLYGASAIFFQMRRTLDRIFGRPARTPRQAMIDTILGRLIAALCVILATTLLVTTLIAQVVLSSLSAELQTRLEISESFWQLVSTGTTVAVVSAARDIRRGGLRSFLRTRQMVDRNVHFSERHRLSLRS
jgi:uncharacterized BrkB/YihY/UPF0761 family membrane protein